MEEKLNVNQTIKKKQKNIKNKKRDNPRLWSFTALNRNPVFFIFYVNNLIDVVVKLNVKI